MLLQGDETGEQQIQSWSREKTLITGSHGNPNTHTDINVRVTDSVATLWTIPDGVDIVIETDSRFLLFLNLYGTILPGPIYIRTTSWSNCELKVKVDKNGDFACIPK